MNNQSRIAALALVMLALFCTNLVRQMPKAHGDPASMAHGQAGQFAPLPALAGVDEPVALTTGAPDTPSSVERHLTVHPAAPIRVTAQNAHHFLIMPRTAWPAKTRMTFTFAGTRATLQTDDDREVRVDLTRQTLTAWEAGQPIRTLSVSTGAPPGWDTPTGTFWIYKRVLDDHMVGGDPNTPDHWDVDHVPYAQYFNGPIAIHGAWWNHRFGRPVSHGCIQLPTNQGPHGATGDPPDAKWLWNFADIGSPVIVTGRTPQSAARAQGPLAYPSPSFRGLTFARSAASYSP